MNAVNNTQVYHSFKKKTDKPLDSDVTSGLIFILLGAESCELILFSSWPGWRG